MNKSDTVEISSVTGETVKVLLTIDEGQAHSCLLIDGVRYHFERVTKQDLLSKYRVDADPDYAPQTDGAGHCYILAPYSE